VKQTFESELDKALNSLKNQGIPVGQVGVMPGGFVFDVNGFLLTVPQILRLKADGELHSQGIKSFADKEEELVEEDVETARMRVPTEQFCSWTATQVCEYINREFDRVHSIGQITAVLNRLKVEYRKV
jgi:hypothetical protein